MRNVNHFQGPFEGIQAYWKLLEYQTRELWDLRKIVYWSDGRIGWRSYEKRGKPSTIDWLQNAREFPALLDSYKALFRGKGVQLHQPFGFMDRGRGHRDLSHFFGGESHNDPNCPCDECDTWERIADERWMTGPFFLELAG